MNIEIGKMYYCPDPRGPRSVHVLDHWDDGAFKVKYSEDDFGCRAMGRGEIVERFFITTYEEAVEWSMREKLTNTQ